MTNLFAQLFAQRSSISSGWRYMHAVKRDQYMSPMRNASPTIGILYSLSSDWYCEINRLLSKKKSKWILKCVRGNKTYQWCLRGFETSNGISLSLVHMWCRIIHVSIVIINIIIISISININSSSSSSSSELNNKLNNIIIFVLYKQTLYWYS